MTGDRAVDNVAKRRKERRGEEQALLAAVLGDGRIGRRLVARR
jgi:hypothetical protein